jgi:DNA-binding beta-propeller fold protein YncE
MQSPIFLCPVKKKSYRPKRLSLCLFYLSKIAEIMVINMHKSVLNNRLGFITVIWTMLLFAGCRSAKITEPVSKPVFFPPPPETPRLQFLKSFSGSEDLGIVTTSAFEKFVVGEPEKVKGIKAPYGLAIHEGKIYVCDVGKGMVEVIDPRKRTFDYLTKDRRLLNPVNIYIDDDGTKYVADPKAGMVFVFDSNNNIRSMLGKELKINPIDVVVRGSLCYVTDFTSNQIVVMDKATGREITRLGKKRKEQGLDEPLMGLADGEFSFISDLALDQQGNIYVTDKAGARITQFDRSGAFRRTIGRLGRNIDEFARPKGIAIDKDDRIWVVDAGTEVAKIYNQQAQLLLFFGLPGNEPGMMNLPTKIVLDYDNIELFKQYAVEGADIEFLVLVSNQYGPNKVSVYGFGSFPSNGRIIDKPEEFVQKLESRPEQRLQPIQAPVLQSPEPRKTDTQKWEQQRKYSDLYYRSIALYKAGQLEMAREGFLEVLKNGQLPEHTVKSIQGYLTEINSALATDEQKQAIADLYYNSMAFYRTGQLEKAREGLTKVLRSGLIPPAMAKTIEKNLADINKTLNKR